MLHKIAPSNPPPPHTLTLLKKDTVAGIFVYVLRKYLEQFFYGALPIDRIM